MPRNQSLRNAYDLAALEAYAVAQFFCLASLSARAVRYVTENQVRHASRLALFLVPVATAAAVRLAAPVFAKRGATGGARLRHWVRLGRPVLALWPLPALLFRGIFSANELFLMLLTAAVVLALEWSLRDENRTLPFSWIARRTSSCLTSPRVPAAVMSVLVIGAVTFACYGSIQVHRKMLTSIFDFGLFENLFWNTLQGRHGIAVERQYFAEHAEFLLYVLLPVYWVFPRSETLLVLQSVLIIGAAVPLFLLARHWLRSGWQAVALVAVYLAYPSVHGSVFYDFHFLALSVFFVLWAAWFYARRQLVPFWLFVVLAATCREDVALGIAAVGVGLVLIGRGRRLGFSMALFGGAWFALVKFVWMERFGSQVFVDYYADLIPHTEHGFRAVIQSVLGNPIYTLSRTLTEDKLLLALHLLTPLAFLPVRHRRLAILLLPGMLVVGLATNRSAITQFQFHYSMHFVPYLFIGSIVALAVRHSSERWPTIAAMLVGSLIGAVQYSGFFGDTFRTSFHDVSFDWQDADANRLRNMQALTQMIPPGASVAAGEHEGTHVSRRAHMRSVKDGIGAMDYVIYSTRSLRWGGDDAIRTALEAGEYGVLATRGDLTLLKRGAPTTKNTAAVRRLKDRK